MQDLKGDAIRVALSALDMEGAGFRLKIDPTGTAKLPVKVLQVKNGYLQVVGEA